MKRGDAYRALASIIGVPEHAAHFSRMTEPETRRAALAIAALRASLGIPPV